MKMQYLTQKLNKPHSQNFSKVQEIEMIEKLGEASWEEELV